MNVKRKIVFVYNPISGSHRLIPVVPIIERFIDKDLYDFSIVSTQYKGHATELAREYAVRGYDAVIAVGGDGTVNEVGCGLIDTDTALGIIPCGSGNGLARHLGIPMDPYKAVKWLDKSVFTEIDYGMMDSQPFFCTCGVGFDAKVSDSFSKSGSRGVLTYLESIMKEIATYHNETYKLSFDNSSETFEAFFITCANADQWGNNAFIAPTASLQDGLLDVIAAHPFSVVDAPLIAFQLFNKMIDKNPNVSVRKCRRLTITRDQEGPAHYDGEPVTMGKEIHIELVQGGLKALIPDKRRTI
ncbi:MAG: diacylglycerol kinase family lipid kinase [Bacteroidaceae bacterium]|nr:diacylglycerol kinase family lipid kinase [Bacteroidaceae bacterium]